MLFGENKVNVPEPMIPGESSNVPLVTPGPITYVVWPDASVPIASAVIACGSKPGMKSVVCAAATVR